MWLIERRMGVVMQTKADIASGVTVSMSGFALWLHKTNAWVAEYMPLITAIGIIGGLIISAWYYWRSIKIKAVESENKQRRMEQQHERFMHTRESDE